MSRLHILVVAFILATGAGQLDAAPLTSSPGSSTEPVGLFYGVGYSGVIPNHTQLATIDPDSGQVTWIGQPMVSPWRLHGLVRTKDDMLYGINGNDDSLYFVDPGSGQLELIGATGYHIAWGLAYDPVGDAIYGLGRLADIEPHRLISYDRASGQVTPIGPGHDGLTAVSGLAWDAAHSRVIAFDNNDDEFYAFDTAGNATLLSVASPRLSPWGIAHDGQHVVMQIKDSDDLQKLAYYDPDTGQRVGNLLTLVGGGRMEALDYQGAVIPEPSTLVLLAVAASILAYRWWRRRTSS